MVLEDADPAMPHPTKLLGMDLVVWRDKAGKWRLASITATMRLPWEFIEAGEHKCSTAKAQSFAVASSVRLQRRSVLLLATVFCTSVQEAFKDFQSAVTGAHQSFSPHAACRCFEDRCPHRLAALSEGRIDHSGCRRGLGVLGSSQAPSVG